MKVGIVCMFCAILISTSCLGSSLSLEFDKKDFHVDEKLKIILCTYNYKIAESDKSYDTLYAVLHQPMMFKSVPEAFHSDTSYTLIDKNGNFYELFFTKLPIINISTENEIGDVKAAAYVNVHDTSSIKINSYAGIAIRGGSSRNWPKKKYEIEFWIDSIGKYIWEVPLLHMRKDKDWVLEAMYNEPLRNRSFTNWQIWRKTHTLYYSNIEKEAKSYINGVYVEVIVNGSYKGIYALTEKMDRHQLQLKKYTAQRIEGELFKSYDWGEASQYFSSPDYDNRSLTWGGYEAKYPNYPDSTNWGNLYDFTGFVVNSTEQEFIEKVGNRFYLPNAVDYFLFLNLITGYDNSAKNLFLAKYDRSSPYFYVPWDLDGTWGVFWDGTLHNYSDIVLSNKFFDKLLADPDSSFRYQIIGRWAELRKTFWKEDVLYAMFRANSDILERNNVYKREKMAWPESLDGPTQQIFLQDWIRNRIKYLDVYFNYQEELITETVDTHKTSVPAISPNPASSQFVICLPNQIAGDQICIIDVSGKMVKSIDLSERCNVVDIGDLREGIYIVRGKDGSNQLLVKKPL